MGWAWAAAGLLGLVVLLASALGGGGAAAAARLIVLVGDSLTEGYAPELEVPPGAVLEGFTWHGRGAAQIRTRLGEYLAHRPSDVVVLAGVNDLAAGRGLAATIKGLVGLWADVKRSGARLYAVQLTPAVGHPRVDPLQLLVLNAGILAAREQPLGPDVVIQTSGLGDERGRLKPEYDAGDHLHLNRAGYRALARLVADALAGRTAAVGADPGTTSDRDRAVAAAWRLHGYLRAARVPGVGSVEELPGGHGELRLRATLFAPTADDLVVVRRVPQVDGLHVHVVIEEA